MRGVFHAFGSRVSALSGIATMAGMGQELDGELLSLLQDEVEHFTDLLEASRSLPRASGDVEGPTQMATILPRVIRLMELNLDTRGLDLQYAGPEEGANTEMGATALTHSLATLLACLGWRATMEGASTLSMSLSTDDRKVRVVGAIAGSAAEDVQAPKPRSAEGPPAPGAIAEGLGAIAAGVAAQKGSLELWGIDDTGLPERFSFNLPALGVGDPAGAS